MCLNPITLFNKSKSSYGGYPYIDVPCNHCEECNRSRRDDLTFRTISLYEYLKSHGVWTPFFCTLTYNEDNIHKSPIYELDSFGTPHFTGRFTRSFNHDDISRFKKSFRHYYTRLGLQAPHMLITSEFGDNTLRPHYHAIIFVNETITWQAFKQLIERFWHYGFTKNIAIKKKYGQGFSRNLQNCIKYVCEYATKYKSNAPSYVYDQSLFLDIPRSKYRPRTFLTNHYGDSCYNNVSETDLIHGKTSLFFDGAYKSFNVPYSLQRKSSIITTCFPWYDCVLDSSHQFESYSSLSKHLYHKVIDVLHTKSPHLLFENLLHVRKVHRTLSFSYRTPLYDSISNFRLNKQLSTLYLKLCTYSLRDSFKSYIDDIGLSPLIDSIIKFKDKAVSEFMAWYNSRCTNMHTYTLVRKGLHTRPNLPFYPLRLTRLYACKKPNKDYISEPPLFRVMSAVKHYDTLSRLNNLITLQHNEFCFYTSRGDNYIYRPLYFSKS